MSAPVTLYSPDGKRSREIAAVDAPGWIKAGWSLTPVGILGEITTFAPDETESVLIVAAPSSPVVAVQSKSKKNELPRDGVPEN